MKVLAKTQLGQFLERLSRDYRVIAPVRQNGEVELVDLDVERLEAGYSGRTRFSPKEHLFPESEVLFTFEVSPQGEPGSIQEDVHQGKTALWGVRPCDLAGIRALDAVFLSSPVDVYYKARRDNTLFLCLNCNDVLKSCFCQSMGTGPFAKEGYDLLFTDLGDEFLVEAGTGAGEELLTAHADLLADSDERREREAGSLEERARDAFTTALDVRAVQEKLGDAFEDPAWAETSAKCTLCGTCCIVCPACHCFNVEDIRKSRKVVQRVRYWDSCQFTGFTHMATSNSRPTQAERWRQKIFDKFVYMPASRGGVVGCSGCGRCLELCQGQISIVEVLTKVISGY